MQLKIINNEQTAELIEKDSKAQCLGGFEKDETQTENGGQGNWSDCHRKAEGMEHKLTALFF